MTDFIEIYEHALAPALCDQIIQGFERSDAKRPGLSGGGVDRSFKDSTDIVLTGAPEFQLLHDQVMSVTVEHLLRYMLKYRHLLVGALATGFDDPQTGFRRKLEADDLTETLGRALMTRLYRPGDVVLQSYAQGVGGYHHWHSEIYPMDASCETLHRVLLFMFYLNTVDEGGETEFLYQQRKIEPRQGRMVIAPAGFTHTHKGHVPASGDKLILTSWVLFNRAENLYTAPA